MSSLRCTYSGGGDYHYFKGGEALNVHSLYVHGVSQANPEKGRAGGGGEGGKGELPTLFSPPQNFLSIFQTPTHFPCTLSLYIINLSDKQKKEEEKHPNTPPPPIAFAPVGNH